LLLLQALANSLAAGNTVILKPSEEAKASEQLIRKILSSAFDPSYVAVTTGPGQHISEHLIEKHHLDMVFFTGSTAVGQKIMQAAARQLTPVILELGGKTPSIVADDAPVDYAARKILFSSFFNAGQTCVATDYILVHHSVKEVLVAALKKYLVKFYGEDARQSNDYGRIINPKHFERLQTYLQQGKVIYGGSVRKEDLYIEPTLMEEVSADAPAMKEEIFGPIKPIIAYASREEAVQWIEERPYPLALYVYTRSKRTAQYFLERVRFGGGCVNNGIIHLGNSHLPFAGVGYSGMGGYHGEYGFQAFSHPKSVLWSYPLFDLPVWYPPYKPGFMRLLKKLMK
jgi:aldehyde dehydrogenase (NAD+)